MSFYPHSLTEIPSVSTLTNKLKDLLETNFAMVSVQGEVSQPTVSTNGHLYFTLKDEGAQLSCVMWRATRQKTDTQLVHGQQITAFGGIKIYAPSGRYQLLVEQVQQAGVGALQAAFERLKRKLEMEGLFEASRKRMIPRFPKSIGVITSETSAAWHDIAVNIEKRWPNVQIKLFHASTQGANAAPELVKGLRYFAEKDLVDTIIIGRGGGSIEDLWPFNEEAVARAIAASPIPVISGVGHETDFTIADFVADVRANTPTQAAIIATPDKNELQQKVDLASRYLKQNMIKKWQIRKQWVNQIIGSYAIQKVRNRIELTESKIANIQTRIQQILLSKVSQKIDLVQKFNAESAYLKLVSKLQFLKNELKNNRSELNNSIKDRLVFKTSLFNENNFKLLSNNPLAPLEKGFARIIQEDKMIKHSSELNELKPIQIEWKDGIKTLTNHG